MIKVIEINDIHCEELKIFSELSEPQLAHFYEPAPGLFISESPNVVLRALNSGYEPVSILMEQKHFSGQASEVINAVNALSNICVPVYLGDFTLLSKITGFELTRGVLCAFKRRILPSVSESVSEKKRIVVLEEVMNPTNVGAIFRCAAAMNMDCVLLTKGCSDPLYRRSVRVSMGTVFQIPWTYFSTSEYIDELHSLGFKIVSMALSDNSVFIDDERLKSEDKLAIIMGSEGPGLNKDTILASDYVAKIPMNPSVDSLNVAAAAAVAFWELRKQ